MSKQRSEQEGVTAQDCVDETLEPEARAREKLTKLWQPGALFHAFTRYPRRRGFTNIDRLAGVLKKGILAPASCDDGSVCSDLNILATGFAVPYDSLVFLHLFGQRSAIYTISEPGRIMVFVNPTLPVITPEEMGERWPLLCQDEVYVRDRVAVEDLIGIAIHPADADAVLAEFLPDFERLALPLYLHHGTAVWPLVSSDVNKGDQ